MKTGVRSVGLLALLSLVASGCVFKFAGPKPVDAAILQYVAQTITDGVGPTLPAGTTFEFAVVKNPTKVSKYVVVRYRTVDEHGSESVWFQALDLSEINTSWSYAQLEAYFAAPGNREDVAPSSTSGVYVGSSGTLYEALQSSSKDLEVMGAWLEKAQESRFAEALESRYGLSESRSQEVAKLMTRWTRISKSRAVTDLDAEALSKEALGASVREIMSAAAQAAGGDRRAAEALILRAAEVNQTSPENVRQWVNSFLR